jgi:hypothetical protein
MQHLRQLGVGLVLSCVMAGTVVANPGGDQTQGATLSLQEYTRHVDLALRPMFSPLISDWIQQRYGLDASAQIRFIAVGPSGVVHVHVDAVAPGKACVFALFCKWENGWKVTQVENHSGSTSGCH